MDSQPLGVEPVNGKIEVRLVGSDAKSVSVKGTIYNRYGLPYVELTRSQERRIRHHFGMQPGYDEWVDLKGDYEGVSVYVVGAKQDRWPECDCCFRTLREDEDIYVEEAGVFCESCYDELYTAQCWWCEEWFQEGDVREARDYLGKEVYVCKDCLKSHFEDCDDCGYSYPADALKPAVGWGNKAIRVCPECLKGFHLCVTCNRYVDADLVDDNEECMFCYENKRESKEGVK